MIELEQAAIVWRSWDWHKPPNRRTPFWKPQAAAKVPICRF